MKYRNRKNTNHFKMVKLGAFVVNRSACSLRFIPRGTGERGTGERGPSDQAHIGLCGGKALAAIEEGW